MKRFYVIFINLLRLIWQLPQLMLGILFGIVCFCIPPHHDNYSKQSDYGGNIMLLKGSSAILTPHVVCITSNRCKSGISFGPIMYLNSYLYHSDPYIVVHKYGHSIQSLYLGWFYLIIVGIPALFNKSHLSFPENWANRLGKFL